MLKIDGMYRCGFGCMTAYSFGNVCRCYEVKRILDGLQMPLCCPSDVLGRIDWLVQESLCISRLLAYAKRSASSFKSTV